MTDDAARLVRGPYPLLSEGLIPLADFPSAARALADAGVTVMQLRLKATPDGERLAVQRAVALALGDWDGLLVVNDRPDLAHILAGESRLRVGLHLGQGDLPPRLARAIVGPDIMIGLSTHDLRQLAASQGEPVDYLAFGPVFPTGTKANADPVVGLDGLAFAARLVANQPERRPLVAIGGIDAARVAAVAHMGASAWAVASALGVGPAFDPRALAARVEALR